MREKKIQNLDENGNEDIERKSRRYLWAPKIPISKNKYMYIITMKK